MAIYSGACILPYSEAMQFNASQSWTWDLAFKSTFDQAVNFTGSRQMKLARGEALIVKSATQFRFGGRGALLYRSSM